MAIERRLIETTADIKNPTPDRRSPKDWTKLASIPAGTRFHVSKYERDNYATIKRANDYAYVADRSDLGALIVANAREVEPETVAELMFVHDCDFGGNEVLRILHKLGRVTAEDFTAVAKAAADDENF